MTKGELIEALKPFMNEIEIFRPVCNKYGEETFEQPVNKVEYMFQTNEIAKILLV
jgi:hypothetical protein